MLGIQIDDASSSAYITREEDKYVSYIHIMVYNSTIVLPTFLLYVMVSLRRPECAFTESNPTCSAGDLDISDCIGGNSDDGITDDEPTTGDSSSSADDPGDTDDNNDTDRTITTAAASRARSWGLSSVVSSTAVAGLLVAVFGAVV